jgi:hypothetical protein
MAKTTFQRKESRFMQTSTIQRENINAQSGRFCQRIGSTVFTVHIYPKEGSPETLEDKILRLLKNDLEFGANRSGSANIDLKNPAKNVTMAMPQADWLPERSSV